MTSPDASLISVMLDLHDIKRQVSALTPDNPALSGWASFAQCDEDGIIRECLGRVSNNTSLSGTFAEIECADGLENNTHQLLLDGFRGVWIDRSSEKIRYINDALNGTAFERLLVLEEMVSHATETTLSLRVKRFLGVESIDFFSLDIDGNDIHVIPGFLRSLNPKIVCVEYNAKFPPPCRLAMRYNDSHAWGGDDYFGASLQSWVDAMNEYSYSLVCCNLSGANAFFVRNDLTQGFTMYAPEELYRPARYALIDYPKGHAPTLKWAAQCLQEDRGASFRFVKAKTLAIPSFDFAIHTGTDQFISSELARDGVWEPFESLVFGRLCRPGDVVLDLGANIGWYAVLAAKLVGADGEVLAFEPDNLNANILEINTAVSDERGVVQIFRSAVSDRVAEALLYKSESNLGDHRLFFDEVEREACQVTVTTLDVFFDGRLAKLPDIVKSDTQGSEAKILKGASRLFSSGWRPILILEFWPFGLTRSGDDPMALWRDLIELEYDIFELSESNPQLAHVTHETLTNRLAGDISPESGGFINLLCIPAGSARLDFIRDLIKFSE